MVRSITKRSRVLAVTATIVIGLLASQYINVSPVYSFLDTNAESLEGTAALDEGNTFYGLVAEADGGTILCGGGRDGAHVEYVTNLLA